MSDLFLLSDAQMRRIEPFFARSRVLARVDDRRVVSEIIYVIRHGLCSGRSRLGVFARIFAALTGEADTPERPMIDATHLKAHRTAASLLKRGSSALSRAHQRRPELEAARRLRWAMTATASVPP